MRSVITEVETPPEEKDGIIWSIIKKHPFYTGAAGAGLYALYMHQKKKDNKEKEKILPVDPKFNKKTDVLTGQPKSKYDIGI